MNYFNITIIIISVISIFTQKTYINEIWEQIKELSYEQYRFVMLIKNITSYR